MPASAHAQTRRSGHSTGPHLVSRVRLAAVAAVIVLLAPAGWDDGLLLGAEESNADFRSASRWLRLAGPSPVAVSPRASEASAGEATVREKPLALTSVDLDEDGVPDLVAAFGTPEGGGLLRVWRGNIDSIFPNTPEAAARRQAGTFTQDPFLPSEVSFAVPTSPDFLGAGDFDADGHSDLVVAERGGERLWLLRGDGRGGLAVAAPVDALGAVTAFEVGEVNRRDGLADLVIGVVTTHGPRVLVFEGPEGALRSEPEVIIAPDVVMDLAIGELDEDVHRDIVVAAGVDLLLIRGRDRRLSLDAETRSRVAAAEVERRSMPFEITAVEAGDFISDHSREVALLDAAGGLSMLEPVPNAPLDAWTLEELGPVVQPSQSASRIVRTRSSFSAQGGSTGR